MTQKVLSFISLIGLGLMATAQPIAEGYMQTDINDLVLIYQGGTHRLDWTQEDFEPYVVHEDAQGNRDWFFDGFLFLEFKDGKGRCYASRYEKSGARKQEWTWLIDRVFEKEKALWALNATIEQHIAQLGKPSHKHRVVLGIPEPIPGQKDWGELKGKALDFDNPTDRISACRWYLDQVQERFEKANFQHLELAGFYWVSEDVATSKALITPVSEYIHQQNKRFYWIPYWGAMGFSDWEKLGFDVAYQQPNHFFNPKIPDERLDDACQMARTNHMGMEVEFDGNALADSKNSTRERLVAYLDKFEQHGVFNHSAIAYYEGGGAIIRFAKSKNPKDIALLDRLAHLVQKRQQYQSLLEAQSWNRELAPEGALPGQKAWILGNARLNTRGKFQSAGGEFNARIHLTSRADNDQVTLRLIPANSSADTGQIRPAITLMHYTGQRRGYVEGGITTAGFNKTTGIEKKASLQLSHPAENEFTLTCRWDAHTIKLYANHILFFAYENYNLNRIYANFPDYWPFDDPFCLELLSETQSSTPILEVQSFRYTSAP